MPQEPWATSTEWMLSGVCVCGHKAEAHHGMMVMRGPFAGRTRPWECLALGCNEDWEPCPGCPGIYVDREDPLRDEKIAAR